MHEFLGITNDIKKILYITKSLEENNGWARYSKGVVGSTAAFLESFVLTSDKEFENRKSRNYLRLTTHVETPLDFLQSTFAIYKKLKFCDAAHCLVEPYIGPTFVASMLRRRKYYLTLHGTYAVIDFKKPIRALMKVLSYFCATGITTGSMQTISKLPTKYIREKVRFIPNGYDDSLFFPVDMKNEQRYLLTVGNLKSRKGQDISIEAISLMDHKNIKLICVGNKENSNFFDLLNQKANAMKVTVEYRENLGDDELRDLYSNAICTISPSRNDALSFEGFPMVIYESNACGTPVIITRGSGSEYAISDGKNGFLLENADPKELALKIDFLIESDSIKRMSEFCVQFAALHTWEKVGKKIMLFYNGILYEN